jgi:hypothetical protein
MHQVNFTIPLTTPPGRYLVRIEQFMPTTQANYSQWYVNCAHVNIVGPGGGKFEAIQTAPFSNAILRKITRVGAPTGFAKFPGTYKISDPGRIRLISTWWA